MSASRHTDSYSPFESHLGVVASLSERLIATSVRERRQREELEQAVRDLALMGVEIDALSEASGLRPADIRTLLERPGEAETLDSLSGLG